MCEGHGSAKRYEVGILKTELVETLTENIRMSEDLKQVSTKASSKISR